MSNTRLSRVSSAETPRVTATWFMQLIDRFIDSLDVAATSRQTYRLALRQFFSWMMRQQLENPTRETILSYKAALDSRGLRPFTRANYLVAVRRFFEWTEGMHHYPNIAKGVKGARRIIKSHHKNALTTPAIKALLSAIDQKTICGLRDYALINLLIRTGLRLIEVSRAMIADLDTAPSGDTILWVRGKGRDGKDAFVIVTDESLEPINAYLRARKHPEKHEPLFASMSDRNYGEALTTFSISRLIKRYLRRAGLDNRRLTAHSLRHTFGVLALRSGASLYEVQLAMRHTAPTTTEVYLGDIEQLKRLEGGPEKRIGKLLDDQGSTLDPMS